MQFKKKKLLYVFRKSSPKLDKRNSCPDAYGALNDSIARSMTMGSIAGYMMPQERVQPLAMDEKSQSTTSLEYQNRFMAMLQPDIYGLVKKLYNISTFIRYYEI